jgi:hypothetical protein
MTNQRILSTLAEVIENPARADGARCASLRSVGVGVVARAAPGDQCDASQDGRRRKDQRATQLIGVSGRALGVV